MSDESDKEYSSNEGTGKHVYVESHDVPSLDIDIVDHEKCIMILKQEKAKGKSAFTKLKNKLLYILDYEEGDVLPSGAVVKEMQAVVVSTQENVLTTMDNLYQAYNEMRDKASMQKVKTEMEQTESDLAGVNEQVQAYLMSQRDEPFSITSSAMSEQLELLQRDEVIARKETERLRAVVEEKEEDFLKRRKKLQEDHEAQIKELELIIDEERKRLHIAEKELERHTSLVERHIEEELGLTYTKDPYHPNMKVNGKQLKVQDSSAYDSQLGHDMWRQLEKVTLPIFSGNKPEYESWKQHSCHVLTPHLQLHNINSYSSRSTLVVRPLNQ